ncbi:MAG: carboxypeptidase-like regulatory domain-containing protein [Hydrotalea sp. AMD]|nr:MAG: carboxypeptidase-like regulatory domain-containing protein [Hydrotalea sp. AMD]
MHHITGNISKALFLKGFHLLFLNMQKYRTILYATFLWICLFFIHSAVVAQGFFVEGKVMDSLTQQPIRNATIRWLHQKRGAVTDSLGLFHLYHAPVPDTLRISCMGYAPVLYPVPVNLLAKIRVALMETNNTLQDVIVYPKGYDPAISLFKKIMKHKPANNPVFFHTLQYDVYHAIEIDVNHLSNKMIQSKLLRPFKQFFFDSAVQGTATVNIPVFIHEQIGAYQFNLTTHQQNYQLYQQKTSGIKNESIIQNMNDFKMPINIYDNYITLLKAQFISPLSANGLNHYHYTITDTSVKESQTLYKLNFAPLSAGGNTFEGYVWVDAKRYAIAEMSMVTAKGSNLNWVDEIRLQQQFSLIRDSVYALTASNTSISFKLLSNKQPGFTAIQTEAYKNVRVNEPIIPLVREPSTHPEVGLRSKQHNMLPADNDLFTFDGSKKYLYQKVDALKQIPEFKTYSNVLKTLATGYYPMGKIDIGNLYKSFTSNYIEGKRFNLGLRTNTLFSKTVQLGGYVGMGMKDKKPRYAFHTLFVFNHYAWETLRFSWQKDFSPLKDNADELNENSLFGSLLLRIPRSAIYLVDNQSFQIQYQKFYASGLSFHIQIATQQLSPLFNSYFSYQNYKPILVNDPNPQMDGYRDNNVSFGVRYAFKEKYVITSFQRSSISSKFPIVAFTFTNGIASNIYALQSDLAYQKYHFSISQHLMIHGVGDLKYVFNAGITNGVLPLVLLDVAKGNDTYYYNQYAFNNMYRYEFASDRYLSFFAEQQLGGFPFNHLPLIYRLKWRSVFSIRALEGSMTEANKIANAYYDQTINYHFKVPDGVPYTEVGYGIDNIFHVLRLDAIWRLTYLHQPNTPSFGLRASLHFTF